MEVISVKGLVRDSLKQEQVAIKVEPLKLI